MNWYLKEYGIKKIEVRSFISIVYALSGWATLFIGQYMFHRYYAFLPLLFFGIERYFNRKKSSWVSFAVALLFLQNYYMMFPTSIFLFIYCLFTIYRRFNKFELKFVINSATRLFLGYFIGFLLSAVVIIPAALYILQNSRVGVNETGFMLWDLNVYLGLLINTIVSPFPVYTEIPNIFYSGTNGHAYWYSLYISIICSCSVFAMFCDFKKYKAYNVVLIILFTLLSIPMLNSVMHAFSEPTLRWSFLIVIFSLLMSAVYLDNYNFKSDRLFNFSKKYLALICIVICISILLSVIDVNTQGIHLTYILISILVAFIIMLIFKMNYKVAFVLTIIELVISSTLLIVTYSNSYYEYNDSIKSDTHQYFNSIDEDVMYRLYVNPDILLPTSPMNLNQSINAGYMSTVSYDSMYDPNLSQFLHLNGIDWHIIRLDNPEVLKMLGVKYFLVYDESELPQEFDFEYVYNYDHLQVYKLIDYKSIGYTYNNFIKSSEVLDTYNDWSNTLIIEDADYDKVKDINENNFSNDFNVIEKYNNGLYGSITNDDKTVLFLSIPYNNGWSAYENGEQLEIIKVNKGLMGIVLEPGEHYINLSFTPNGFKIGAICTGSGLVIFLLILITECGIFKSNKGKK